MHLNDQLAGTSTHQCCYNKHAQCRAFSNPGVADCTLVGQPRSYDNHHTLPICVHYANSVSVAVKGISHFREFRFFYHYVL